MRTSQAKPRTLGNPYDRGVLSRKVSYWMESHSDLSPWWFVLLPEFSAKGLTFEGEVKENFLLNCMLSELEPFVDDRVRLREEEWIVHSFLCGFGVGRALHINSNEGQRLKWLCGGHCFAPPPPPLPQSHVIMSKNLASRSHSIICGGGEWRESHTLEFSRS